MIGLDLGTGGARAMVVSDAGRVLASAAASIEVVPEQQELQRIGRHEQEPAAWWRAVCAALRSALAELSQRDQGPVELCGLSVDGTSGTILGVGPDGAPTTPALMYDDGRASEAAQELESRRSAGIHISATSGIAKIRWLQQHRPQAFDATHVFLHQADWIASRLGGEWGWSDASNALKSGYDLSRQEWGAWLDGFPELRAKLPRVVESGSECGRIEIRAAKETGLPVGLPVIAGVTDGTAAFLASGASQPGEDNTTLGTTLVFKRVALAEVRDPEGLIYCHRLPGGHWLPGAASNVGGRWIREEFGDADLAQLDRQSAALLPAPHLAYPATGRGERFPFRWADAQAFCLPAADSPLERYAAKLQGTAFVERLAYEVLDRYAPAPHAEQGRAVFATGGGARSDLWLQLRADVCARVFHRPVISESAFGSAVLAAGSLLHADLGEASRQMVRLSQSFHPDAERHERFAAYYARFHSLLEDRGYLMISP